MPPVSTIQDRNELFAQYQILEDLGDFPTYSLFKVKAPNGSIKLWKKVDLQFNAASIETRLLPVIEKVSHPYLNAVSGSFLFQDKGLLFVESEFPVKTLRHRLEEIRSSAGAGSKIGIPISELFSYMSQASEAIDYLNTPQHAYQGKKIATYHRALSPDSLHLFEEKGKIVCKVGDFGLAKPIIDSADSARHSLGMTNYDYAPPEFDEGVTTNTSDQYSLALTYCELRTGQLPFTGTLLQKVQAQLSGNPDLSLLEPNERPVVARALSRDPHARFPSCREFMKQLQLAAGGVMTAPLLPVSGGGLRPTAATAAISAGTVAPAGAGGSLFGGANTGWAQTARPVGRSGGALFSMPANMPAKSDEFKKMSPAAAPLPAPPAPAAPAPIAASKPRAAAAAPAPKTPEIKPSTPRVPTPVQSEGWSVDTAQNKASPKPEPAVDTNWTPGKVEAGPSRAMMVGSSNPDIKITPPPPQKPAIRPEAISSKARETLEIIKRKQASASIPPVTGQSPMDKPGPGTKWNNLDTDSTDDFPALAPPPLPTSRPVSRGPGALGETPSPPRPPNVPTPRRASTPSMGLPLPARNVTAPGHQAASPGVVSERSAARQAVSLANPAEESYESNQGDVNTQGFRVTWVTLLMVMIATFCIGMMLLVMLQKK